MAGKPGTNRSGEGGRPPTNLRAVVAYRASADGGQVPLTVMDVVEETIRTGGFIKDAAARVGVTVHVLREWRRIGNRCLRDVLDGAKRRSQLSRHERLCCELATKMDKAEAEARVLLLGKAQRLAQGGLTRTETTERRDASGAVVERTERQIELLPDSGMIQWLLSHRWRDDFGRQAVEVSGPDGGPVQLESAGIVERLREALAGVRENQAETTPEAIESALAAKGNGHRAGNGTHP